jgi:hypothetical protein
MAFYVNNAYDRKLMAIYREDRSTSEFTVDISKALSTSQSLTASNSVTPERRRLYTLGYI